MFNAEVIISVVEEEVTLEEVVVVIFEKENMLILINGEAMISYHLFNEKQIIITIFLIKKKVETLSTKIVVLTILIVKSKTTKPQIIYSNMKLILFKIISKIEGLFFVFFHISSCTITYQKYLSLTDVDID